MAGYVNSGYPHRIMSLSVEMKHSQVLFMACFDSPNDNEYVRHYMTG
jgi:hypothetical protein